MIVTCIQDNFYMSWQAEVLARNCRELGHELLIIIGMSGGPSAYASKLEAEYGALLIEDLRDDKSYAPSIQPHLLARFVKRYYSGGAVVLVDSDVLFRDFHWLDCMTYHQPGTVLMSDCSSYLDAAYLDGTDPDLLEHLAGIAGIDPGHIRQHKVAGGAQYIFPHLFDVEFWERIERNSCSMWRLMRNYRCHFHQVQTWTASMWAILYELYRRELAGECSIATDPALDFCFATDPVSYWRERAILHMAGATGSENGLFFKGEYINKRPWDCDLSHVRPETCSYVYTQALKTHFPPVLPR